MRIGLYIKSRFGIYQREFSIIIAGAGVLFILGALVSYNPHDQSWFYYSTSTYPITNWCGAAGAQIAALAWYLFGRAVWLFGLALILSMGMLISHDSVRSCWERIATAVMVPIIVAALWTFHTSQSFMVSTEGGLCGWWVYTVLYHRVGAAGLYILLMTSLACCLIISGRLSKARIIQLARVCVALVNVVWSSLRLAYTFVRRVLEIVYERIVSSVRKIAQRFVASRSNVVIPSDELSEISSTAGVVAHHHENQLQEQMQDHTVHQTMTEQQVTLQESVHDDAQTHVHQYVLPSLSLFIAHEKERTSASVKQELEERARALEEKLRHFGISGTVIEIKRGPVVSVFEYLPAIDTKLSKIVSLEDDLAMALQATSIRILAPIPGKSVVGFEVANKKRQEVLFCQVVKSPDFVNSTGAIPIVLGKDTVGTDIVVDLARMPHLLIAGSTGSGKSVALNAMLISLLCRKTPDELRLILIDPKRLEFAAYADIAHLLFPIVTDPRGAAPVLRWVVTEMERRYERMASCGVRNVADFNRCTRHVAHADPLPYIVVIIDELSDLMMTAGKEVEDLITRIAQMARAAGIHMIVATQRPSVDVITGLIKVNFPSRISFRVTSKIDSRTILDTVGADKLLGNGDMLFLDAASSTVRRIHGAYITSDEIEAVVTHIRAERGVNYIPLEFEAHDDHQLGAADDQLFAQVVDFLQETDEISISLLQRRFKIGYNRSARIIEFLETKGMILPADGGKTRKVVR